MFDAFTLRPDGTVVGLYTDAIDLRVLGHVRAERASAVEWEEPAQAWRAKIFATGEVLGPFRLRDEAVDAERRALAAQLRAVTPAPEASNLMFGARHRPPPDATARDHSKTRFAKERRTPDAGA
jgi:hypothetical protein